MATRRYRNRRTSRGGTTSGAWIRVVRFCVTFVLLVAVYALIFSTPWVERYLHAPVSRLVALTSVPLLSLFGEVAISGTNLEFEGFRAVIVEACNGVLPTYIFLAAVVAFPSSWREKLRGAMIGVPLIFPINVFRVVTA